MDLTLTSDGVSNIFYFLSREFCDCCCVYSYASQTARELFWQMLSPLFPAVPGWIPPVSLFYIPFHVFLWANQDCQRRSPCQLKNSVKKGVASFFTFLFCISSYLLLSTFDEHIFTTKIFWENFPLKFILWIKTIYFSCRN